MAGAVFLHSASFAGGALGDPPARSPVRRCNVMVAGHCICLSSAHHNLQRHLLSGLLRLELVDCSLTSLVGFEDLPALEFLNVARNEIATIGRHLQANERLQTLILDRNPLVELTDADLPSLRPVVNLSLRHTKLYNIFATLCVLVRLPRLQSLSIGSNLPLALCQPPRSPAAPVSVLLHQAPLTGIVTAPGAPPPTPFTHRVYYRAFLLSQLPALQYLDDLPIDAAERAAAGDLAVEHLAWLEPPPRPLPLGVAVATPSSSIAASVGQREWLGRRHRREGQLESHLTDAFVRQGLRFRPQRQDPFLQRAHKPMPRQFEYHPLFEDVIVYGSFSSSVIVDSLARPSAKAPLACSRTCDAGQPAESILGLSWLKKHPHRFLCGSEFGGIYLFDSQQMGTSAAVRSGLVHQFPSFPSLTCVQGNSTDQFMLASGGRHHVFLYDLAIGVPTRRFHNIHQEQINVLRFAHHSPHFFATSSFDRTIKYWDLRVPGNSPQFSQTADRALMMVCFSPDDRFLLSSGVDNDVRQWNIAQGGCLDLQYQLAPTGLAHNWTRSYYLASGRYIVVGGCREDTVTVACSRTGKIVQQVDLNVEPSVPYSDPMSCLSLRGDPHHPSRFANIVSSCNPRSATRRTKYTLVTVDLCERAPSCPDAMR